MELQAPIAAGRPGVQQRIADLITAFCGSMLFVYIHAVVVAA